MRHLANGDLLVNVVDGGSISGLFGTWVRAIYRYCMKARLKELSCGRAEWECEESIVEIKVQTSNHLTLVICQATATNAEKVVPLAFSILVWGDPVSATGNLDFLSWQEVN